MQPVSSSAAWDAGFARNASPEAANLIVTKKCTWYPYKKNPVRREAILF